MKNKMWDGIGGNFGPFSLIWEIVHNILLCIYQARQFPKNPSYQQRIENIKRTNTAKLSGNPARNRIQACVIRNWPLFRP